MSHESRLTFSTEEILANVPTREALVVKGVKCHGGFDADGHYRSPRTAFRVPAIKAWQEQHVATSGSALFEIPADTVSPQVPNVAQVKFLLRSGVREPMVRWLSEIAIVEGFGAMIRELPVPPLKSFIREDTHGTALAHLTAGLFEAHARDEAGWSEEGGHRQMWDAARDAALSNPNISPEIYAQSHRAARHSAAARDVPRAWRAGRATHPLHDQRTRDRSLRRIDVRMGRGNPFRSRSLRRAPRRREPGPLYPLRRIAARRVPAHALSEIQARTLLTLDGKPISGRKVVDDLADRGIRAMVRQRLNERPVMVRDLIRKTANVKDIDALMREFDALATTWTPPARYADLAPQPEAAPQGY